MVDYTGSSKKPQSALDAPLIVPCFYGQELNMSPEVAMTGLSAIAVKPPPNKPPTPSVLQPAYASLCARNSFWDLHRPELSKLPWAADASAGEVMELFRLHSVSQGEGRVELEGEGAEGDPSVRVILAERDSEAEEEEDESPMALKARALPLTDEDLSPEVRLHRSGGELCVMGRALSLLDDASDTDEDTDGTTASDSGASAAMALRSMAVPEGPRFRAPDGREEEVVLREFLPIASWETREGNKDFTTFCSDVIANKC